MQWVSVLEWVTYDYGPHIPPSVQCPTWSLRPVSGSQVRLHFLYHLVFTGSPPGFSLPSGASSKVPQRGHPSSRLLSPLVSPHIISSQKQFLSSQEHRPSPFRKEEKKSGFKSSWRRFLFLCFSGQRVRPLPGSLKVRILAGAAGRPSTLQNFCT